MNNDHLDLSSFPLLRIDQIQQHETKTLVEAEAELRNLGKIDSISPFVSKLLARIRLEMSTRSENDAYASRPMPREAPKKILSTIIPSTSSLISTKRWPTIMGSSTRKQPSPNKGLQSSFVVSSSPSSKASNFRSRAKLAKESIQTRSLEAANLKHERQRHERTRQALDTMQGWRLEREKSKKRREDLLEEEREQRRRRWKAKKEKERQLHSSMHAAAEEAKSAALEAGCTHEEAIVEAAQAAAKVADDESTADSEDDLLKDDFTDAGTLVSTASADGEAIADCKESKGSDDVDSRSTQDHGVRKLSSEENTVEEHDVISGLGIPSICKGEDIGDDAVEQREICSGDQSLDGSNIENVTEAANPPCDGETPSESINDPIPATVHLKPTDIEALGDGVRGTAEPRPADKTETIHLEATADDHVPVANFEDAFESEPITSTTAHEVSIQKKQHHELEDQNEEAKPASSTRTFCNTFPSFADIFAKSVTEKGRKSTSDLRHKDLTALMRHQVGLYEKTRAAFAAIRDSTSDSEDDDSDSSFCDSEMFFRINSRRPEVASIVRKSFSHRSLSSWEELDHDIEGNVWNLMWVWGIPKAADFECLLVFQKINRFRNTRGITRKDLLKKNIQRYAHGKKDTDSFNIMPLTFSLPMEFNAFVSGFQSIQKFSGNNFWIMKPVGSSRGRGISIASDISDVSYSQPIVIQRYISDPLLFMGYKWDLRMYVLVTSFSPLQAYLYKEGLARFASRKYSSKVDSLDDLRIHLTNSSIQKEFNEDIDGSHPACVAGINGAANKAAFSWLWKRLQGVGMDTDSLWLKITDTCHKALIAAGSDIPYQPSSFEIFGFDIMFDQQLKCWLIEVNSSPSLGCDSQLDERVKGSLIRDTIALVDPPVYSRKNLVDVCKRRMVYRKSADSSTLEKDLSQILKGRAPRRIGDKPKRLGNFEQIA